MKSNFEACIEIVLGYEGGYSLVASDPGNFTGGKVGVGELKGTKFGIAASSYPNLDIKNLTINQAKAIFRIDYWNAVHGDDLPLGVDLATFDYAVNSGPVTAIKALQACASVVPDGVIGPLTLAAVAKDRNTMILMLCAQRSKFLENLPAAATFGAGWAKRVASVRQHALNMASAPASAPIQPYPPLPKPTPAPIAPKPPTGILGLLMAILRFFGAKV